ncbi:hypothetical protein [Algoriphagus resistens]|uniref:hypothetical protein n=1 Tax=Algoriphagus resistens TaxID=1750590 RepID=UPI000716A1BA|nr:hypothetical protein [Algoriphagus resistens]
MNLTFPVTGDNYGGVDRFWFAHEDDIAGTDASGQILLKEGKFWNLGKATKYSIKFSNPDTTRRGGTTFNPSITGKVKKYRPELESVLSAMRGEKFALIIKDKNGFLIQVGRPGELLTFGTDQDTGELPSDNNEYRFSFRGQTSAKPVSFATEIPVDPSTPEEPSTGLPVKIYLNGSLVATVPTGGSFSITTEFTLEYQILP